MVWEGRRREASPYPDRRPWPAALALATVRSGSAGSGLSRGVMAPVVPTLRDRVPVHAPEDRGTQPRGDDPRLCPPEPGDRPELSQTEPVPGVVSRSRLAQSEIAPRVLTALTRRPSRSYLRPDPSASRLGPRAESLNALRVNAARSVVFQAAGSMETNRPSRAWLRARAASLSLMAAATASSWSKEVPA